MSSKDPRRNLAPLLLASGVSIGLVPWLHPDNTCQDWLVKWAQQSMHAKWVAIHELGMAGFAAAAMIGVFLAVFGDRTWVSLFGASGFCAGFLIHANVSISHATEVSFLARTYVESSNPETQNILRNTALAMLAYDDAAWRTASVLVTGGGIMMMWALWREGTISRSVAMVSMLLASVWALQPLGIIRRIFGTQIPEIYYWQVVTAWFMVLAAALWHRSAPETFSTVPDPGAIATAPMVNDPTAS